MEATRTTHSSWCMQWTTCMRAVSSQFAAGRETTVEQSQDQASSFYTMSATTFMQGRSPTSGVQEVLAVVQAVCLFLRPVIELHPAFIAVRCR